MSGSGELAVAETVTGRAGGHGSPGGPPARFGTAILLASSLLFGCSNRAAPEECLSPPTVEASAPITRFGVHFMAGEAPLHLGTELTSANGATFKTTKARMYLSQVALRGENGERVSAELVDEQGNRLPYGVTLVDLDNPDSLNVYVQVPAGNYRGMAVSVGVPETCSSGEGLNHSDASAMEAPLGVDSDMYWSWNPGYVFLKFEGQVKDASGWKGFFYHVGGDERFASLELDTPFSIPPEGGSGPELIADFNQLLVSPTGTSKPDLTNTDEREVHGGTLADSLAENLRGSHFLRLAQGHE